MTRKIRISVEISDANDSVEYIDLPDGWDDWHKADRQAYLEAMAASYLAEQASSGASVVDENDEEVDE